MPEAVRDTLLKASTMMYLFRAMIAAETAAQKREVEMHIVSLVNDVSGTDGGFVLLVRPGQSLSDSAREREFPGIEKMIEGVCAGEIVHAGGVTAGPLHARSRIEGALGVMGNDCSEVLSAVLTLASAALTNARESEDLRAENNALRSRAAGDVTGIVGESAGILRLKSMIERVAPQDATVLVLGESGTGKELVATAIHARSRRSGRPFVAINCAALSENLLESELFGHEKGAFTGADRLKKGKLELAQGGTVFLDEIGEMAPRLQAKLLRVLQERNFERVGGTQTLPLDIRLIAATNRDIGAGARSGEFRLDLYHRLNVITLNVPPLRERVDDIVPLARFFLNLASARCGRRVVGLSEECARCLVRYPWPGNVRELQNAIERAAILGTSEWLLPEDLPEGVLEAADPGWDAAKAYQSALGEARRQCVIRAWNEAGNDHDEAARLLGMHPNSLRRLIRHLGLREALGKGPSRLN